MEDSEQVTLSDALIEFVTESGGPQTVKEWSERYPQYSLELIEFAISWAHKRDEMRAERASAVGPTKDWSINRLRYTLERVLAKYVELAAHGPLGNMAPEDQGFVVYAHKILADTAPAGVEELKSAEESEAMGKKIFDEIAAERVRQDDRWGGPKHDDALSFPRLGLFIERHALSSMGAESMGKSAEARRQMVQTAALAVAAIEWLDRRMESENGD